MGVAKDPNGNMSAAPRKPADEAPASVPQTPPPAIGQGHPEYHFVQGLMQMQQAIGEVKSSVESLKGSVDGMRVKVDDLVGWKHKIIGGAVVLMAIGSIIGYVIGKASDYVTFKAPTPAAIQAPAHSPAPSPPAEAPKKP